jgi:hypothetical protein
VMLPRLQKKSNTQLSMIHGCNHAPHHMTGAQNARLQDDRPQRTSFSFPNLAERNLVHAARQCRRCIRQSFTRSGLVSERPWFPAQLILILTGHRCLRLFVFAFAVALFIFSRSFFAWKDRNVLTKGICIIGIADSSEEASRAYLMWEKSFPVVYSYVSSSNISDKRAGLKPLSHTLYGGQVLFDASSEHLLTVFEGCHRALHIARASHECAYYFVYYGLVSFSFASHESMSARFSASGSASEVADLLFQRNPLFLTFATQKEGTGNARGAEAKGRVTRIRETPGDLQAFGGHAPRIIHGTIIDMFFPASAEADCQNSYYNPDSEHSISLLMLSIGGYIFDGVVLHSITFKMHDAGGNLLSGQREAHNGFPKYAEEQTLLAGTENERLFGDFVPTDTLTIPRTRRDLPLSFKRKNSMVVDIVSPSFARDNRVVLDVLLRLSAYVDPRSPALTKSSFISQLWVQNIILDTVRHTSVHLRVMVLICSNVASIKTLIHTLTSELRRARIEFELPILSMTYVFVVLPSYPVTADDDHKLRSMIGLLLPTASVRILSLRGAQEVHLEKLWVPSASNSYSLILKSSARISPVLIQSSLRLIRSVFYGPSYPFETVASICLETKSGVGLNMHASLIDVLSQTDSLRQTICDGGAIYAASGWLRYRSWLLDPGQEHQFVLKDALSNGWTDRAGNFRTMLRFMAEKNMFTYHPMFPSNKPLVTMSNEPKLEIHTNNLIVSTYSKISTFIAQTDPDPLKAPRFDYKLEKLSRDYNSFDGCTLVMPTCHRWHMLSNLLNHYAAFPFPAQFIVVQQPCEEAPSDLQVPHRIGNISVILKRMRLNDMNNRYLNFPEIKYDCILNLDDDVLHPIDAVRNVVEVWRSHYFDHLVGWTPQGRLHVFDGSKFQYKNRSSVHLAQGIASMLLPSGTAYHRRFLTAYNSEANRQARNVVTRERNCEDILMNFVVANATHQGPVMLKDWTALERDELWKNTSNDGEHAQWKKSDHFLKRSLCLNEFAKIYNGMPLKYSTTMFQFDKTVQGEPVLDLTVPVKTYMYNRIIPSRKFVNYATDLCHLFWLDRSTRALTCPHVSYADNDR